MSIYQRALLLAIALALLGEKHRYYIPVLLRLVTLRMFSLFGITNTEVYFGLAQYVLELEGLVSILPAQSLSGPPILLKNKVLLVLRRILGDEACIYRSADKSLARPGRKQTNVSVRTV